MAKDSPEIVKVTLNTSTMPDPFSIGQTEPTFRGVLKNLDTDLHTFEKVLQSATNSFEYFNNNLKSINKETGYAQQSFYIRKDELKNAKSALYNKNAEMDGLLERHYGIDVREAEYVQGSRKIYGTRAQKKAMEEVDRLGGFATVNTKDKDKLDFIIPFDKEMLNGLSSKERSALINQAIPEARKLSSAESRQRKKEAQREEQEIQAREQLNKDKNDVKRSLVVTESILRVLAIIGDVVRRILTASLKQATENNKMAVEAHSVGVSTMARRGYDIFDLAHGMQKGTSFGAVSSVQGMFGDVTNLNENALKTLARVMGSEISELVNSGMGGKNPDQLLDNILDKYFKQFLSGKNTLGQVVGMEQARRELITSLQSVSPEIAKLFARMADDYTSGYYGSFSNVEEWRNTTETNRAGLTQAQLGFNTEIGKKLNEIVAIWTDLKTSVFAQISNSLYSILDKISNWRIGESATERVETDKKNKELNAQNAQFIQNKLGLYNANSQNALDAMNGSRFSYTTELLAGLESGKYDKKYFLEHPDLATSLGIRTPSDFKEYKKQGEILYKKALYNTETQDELVKAYALLQLLQDIEKENAKEVGSGKLAKVSVTDTREQVLAQKYLRKKLEKIDYEDVKADENARALVANAYYNYLINNQDSALDKLGNLNTRQRIAYNKEASKIAKEKGIKKEDLSLDDRIRALADSNALDWFGSVFNAMGSHSQEETNFLLSEIEKAVIQSTENADSNALILNSLVNTLKSNSSYGALGGALGGNLTITVQMKDDKGNTVGEAKKINLGDAFNSTPTTRRLTNENVNFYVTQ